MTRPVVPVRSLATRLPDAGRIRIGVKVPASNGKTRPEKIDRFRFTSPDRTALDQIAAVYGGHVGEWDEPKAAPGQWQVITEANELRIALPPDPLGTTPIYELWGGGGCQRRCDGELCEMLTHGQDGLDLQQVPCLCDRKGVLECKLITRLSVLLPEVRFSGVWRLDTKSFNAAAELPGMVELIRSLQDRGIVRATMRVEWRRQVLAGQTREFAVPVLGIEQSLQELAAGHARLGALTAAQGQAVAAIGAGDTQPADAGSPGVGGAPSPSPDPDDQVVEAEVVDDDRGVTDRDIINAAGRAFAVQYAEAPRGKKSLTIDRLRHAATWAATKGRAHSLKDCAPEDLPRVLGLLGDIEAGRVTVDADPVNDAAGATFTLLRPGHPDGDKDVTVLWSEFEQPAEAVTL